MDKQEKESILERAYAFFSDVVAKQHVENTEKLDKLSKFNVNPFTVSYLATFAFGDLSPTSIAKTLLYPRVLGTSIATSFGTNIQTFCHEVLGAYASTTAGMDIEFVDAVDARKKYCQLKAGPTTINNPDVKTIEDHFLSLRNLARTNHLPDFNPMHDCCVGILYGEHADISTNYKMLEREYPVYTGSEFWYRLTGDEGFYKAITGVFAQCAKDYVDTDVLDRTILLLAQNIRENRHTLPFPIDD